jgi:hypothetical protein
VACENPFEDRSEDLISRRIGKVKNIVRALVCATALCAGGAARADSVIGTTDPSSFSSFGSPYYPDPYRWEDGYYLPSENTVFAYDLNTGYYDYFVTVDSPGTYWSAADSYETGYPVPFDEIFLDEFPFPNDGPGVTFSVASYVTGRAALLSGFGLNLYEYTENFTATLQAYNAAGVLVGSVTEDLQGGILGTDPTTTNTFIGIIDPSLDIASVVVTTTSGGQPDNTFSIGSLYMSPIPEPGTWTFMAGGLTIFGLLLRKRVTA